MRGLALCGCDCVDCVVGIGVAMCGIRCLPMFSARCFTIKCRDVLDMVVVAVFR